MRISVVLCNVEESFGLRISGEVGIGDSIKYTVDHYCNFFKISVQLHQEGPNYMLFKFSKPYVEGYVLEACMSIARNLDTELEVE